MIKTAGYFYGPNKSGKKDLLKVKAELARLYKLSVLFIFPSVIRYNQEHVEYLQKTLKGIDFIFYPDTIKVYSLYFIFYSHLFTVEDLDKILSSIYKKNATSLIAIHGIDRDYLGNEFDTHKYLMEVSIHKEKLNVLCSVCGEFLADYSQLVLEDEEVLSPIPDLYLINLEEKIEPRCALCFVQ